MSRAYDDFQRRASQIGKAFATWCEVTLQSIGFILHGKQVFKDAGVEVDQVATNQRGQRIYFEFKGSSAPPRPGMQRTDTVKKALCNAFLLDKINLGPYIVITSHKPKAGTSAERMISLSQDILFDVICISIEDDFARLRSYAQALPWRNVSAARQPPESVLPLDDDFTRQLSLFGITSLHSFNKHGQKVVRTAVQKKKAV